MLVVDRKSPCEVCHLRLFQRQPCKALCIIIYWIFDHDDRNLLSSHWVDASSYLYRLHVLGRRNNDQPTQTQVLKALNEYFDLNHTYLTLSFISPYPLSSLTLNFTKNPFLNPIQPFCISLTLVGQSKLSNPSTSLSA